MMKWLLPFLFLSTAHATTGFVQVRPDRELYVEWTKAAPGQPTVVLLNGLTYSTRQWDRFALALEKNKVGVLRYDPYGMGQTLLRYAPVLDKVSLQNQVQDLRDLLRVLDVQGPVNLVGLSYGGGVGIAFAVAHPKQVHHLILMAPYTEPIKEQDQWIQSQVWYTRKINPQCPYSDDEIYDFFLRQIVYQTYPRVEPIVLENPYKLEAVFQMTRGIRTFRAAEVLSGLAQTKVHLMIAGADQYVKRSTLIDFWKQVPTTSKQSLILINNTEHKIPEAIPMFSAAWVEKILREDPLTRGNQDCEGDAITGQVRCQGGLETKLPREDGEVHAL